MEPFIAQIILFAGNFAPRGWAFCEGQLLAIANNQALFALVGTTYGGDGRTTFGLPDLRGRVAIGPGQGPGLPDYRQGHIGGTASTTLTVANMPSHNHALMANSSYGTTAVPASNSSLAATTDGRSISVNVYSTNAPNVQLAGASVGNAGGSQPINNMQPYLAIPYIIALVGIFPSRN
jgi:microcystin-dependent protein